MGFEKFKPSYLNPEQNQPSLENEAQKAFFERYLELLKLSPEELSDKKVLDLGCGEEGYFVRAVMDRGNLEAYGLDRLVHPSKVPSKYQGHILNGDISKELPIRDVDLIVSVASVTAAVWNDDLDRIQITNHMLSALKAGGEMRIYSIPLPRNEETQAGLNEDRTQWLEALKELQSQKVLTYTLTTVSTQSHDSGDNWENQLLTVKKL